VVGGESQGGAAGGAGGGGAMIFGFPPARQNAPVSGFSGGFSLGAISDGRLAGLLASCAEQSR
jgi:hypothetical protein